MSFKKRISISAPPPNQIHHQKELDAVWNRAVFGTSQHERETSDRVIYGSFRLCDERGEESDHASNEVQFHLHQRLQDMELWITEFTRKSEEIKGQVDRVRDYLIRVDHSITAIPPILKVDYDICKIRESRIGIDKVVDEPHKLLQLEIKLLIENQSRLESLRKEGNECIRLLRKMGHAFGKQLQDRKKAVDIDYAALHLNPHSTQVIESHDNNSEKMRNFSLVSSSGTRKPFHTLENEKDWENLSLKEVNAAEKLLKDADNFMVVVESNLQSSCEGIQTAICNTNAAFECRLVGLRRVKAQLEQEHEQISINIRNIEDTLDKLKKSIVEKEALASLAETRLKLRDQRPNFELVKDQVQKGLELEMISLQNSIRILQRQLESTYKILKSLLANQLRVEDEINVKVQSIAIDETQVLPWRKTVSVQLY